MKKNSYKLLVLMFVLFLGIILTSCGDKEEGHKHVEEILPRVEATCATPGKTTGMQCSSCKQILVAQEVIPALGHEYGDWYKITDTEEQRDCKNCTHHETRNAEEHTHSFGDWSTVTPATCTTTGVEGRKCSCGEEETRVINVLKHDTKEHSGKTPTCTEAGYQAYVTCANCDYTTYKELPALGHAFGEWYATSSVQERRDCAACSHYETKDVENTEPHTHSFGSWYVDVQATCTENGIEKRNCLTCSFYEPRTINATGHSFGSWYISKPATTTETGIEKRECNNCDHFETKSIPATGGTTHTHSFGSWGVTTKATCTTTGLETRKCSCGEEETRVINATGHSFGDWYISKPATTTEAGTEKRECNNCDHFETKSIPATGSTTDTNALLQADLDAISLPSTLSASYKYTNTGANGTKFTYLSSNAGVLDDEGNVTRMLYDVDVTVKVIGVLNGVEKEKQVTIKVLKYELPAKTHQIILNASDFPVPDNSTTFKKGNGYIELNTNKVNNYFYCGEGEEYIAPRPFTGLVVSWGAIDTSSTAKVTVDIKLRVNGTWSDYVSYGSWGFEGSNGNASKTDSTGLIKISTDEISVLNGKTADAIRYKVNLSRSSASAVSPKIKYLSFAFDYSSYSYSVNKNHLPEKVFHNVPKRYQLDVAGDGNVMCSATSTTMMLEYHGIDLSAKTKAYGYTYPQEYIARKVVRDVNMSGGGFGNWVYNTVSMSHYGFKSYVARYYSIEELMYDLTKGPVCLSIKKCTMTQYENYKTYTHSGHIIVAVGYQYINGQLYITCNDPYVPQVTCNYSATLLTSYWKNIGYVIE